MIPNTNETTGIPYGLISARSVPYLYEDITTHGVNETYDARREEVRDAIEEICADFDSDEVPAGTDQERVDAVADCFNHTLVRRIHVSSREAEAMTSGFIELLDTASMTFDITEVVEALMQILDDSEFFAMDDVDCRYTYKTDGVSYITGSLGGAALIWVTESPFVTYCAKCSPCVTGAGDLDSPREASEWGSFAYCLPSSDWCLGDNEEVWPYGIWNVSVDGQVGSAAWVRADGATDA
jgi:hypothetical protein